ncbi:PEP/pyruvate-binding domain-containing protein [Sphingobacterium corticis]|uniref:PEP/pyruvate-binding domain-containing protein n=1 Tax=Sphingobacterium corticis TaxID=1812823 RepID=A0ABW5NE36_9SPHI
MIFIQDNQTHYISHEAIGSKAKGLFMARAFDLNVPRWAVLPEDYLAEVFKTLSSISHKQDLLRAIDSYVFPPAVEAELAMLFPNHSNLAVLASPSIEIGHEAFLNERFDNFLCVPQSQVLSYVKQVWRSLFSDEVLQYRSAHRLAPSLGIAVIIQEVVEADASGKAFGLHPKSGNRKQKWISATFGVSGEANDLEQDRYIVSSGGIDRQIARKREKQIWNVEGAGNLYRTDVARIHQHDQAVSDEHIFTLSTTLDRFRAKYQQFFQLEFVVSNNELFLTNAVPILGVAELIDKSGVAREWDSRRFKAEFSGVITPLTFSCLRTFEKADAKYLVKFLGASDTIVERNKSIFSNILGLMNGRIYENIHAKQAMEMMLPSHKIDIRLMNLESPAKAPVELVAELPLTRNQAWWSVCKLMVKFYRQHSDLDRQATEFSGHINKVVARFNNKDWQDKDLVELMQLYRKVERTMIWKVPQKVDFYFETLLRWLKQYVAPFSENPLVSAEALLLDTTRLVTMYPIRRRLEIAEKVQRSELLKTLFQKEDIKQIWYFIQHDHRDETMKIKHIIEDYLSEVDQNCVANRLIDLREKGGDPLQLITSLKQDLEDNVFDFAHAHEVELQIRNSAEEVMKKAFRRNPIKQKWFNKIVLRTRKLFEMRETFAYDHLRLWGILRQLFHVFATRFSEEGLLEFKEDIHYLTKEEIFDFIQGHSIHTDLQSLVAVRKEEYDRFEQLPIPNERINTFGIPYHSNDFFPANEETIPADKTYRGEIACSGKAKGVIKIWDSDSLEEIREGDIIVLPSADLRFENKLKKASGLLIQNGSIWQPLCTLARQNDLPCLISANFSHLNDGDLVEVDGYVGEVIKI